jgi:hypothetical protein
VIRHAINTGWPNHDPAPGINRPKLHRIRSWKHGNETLISDHGVMRATLADLVPQSNSADICGLFMCELRNQGSTANSVI